MVNKEDRKRIRKMARKLGIKLSKRHASDSYEWDGNSIAVDNWERDASNIIHDIAHWLISDEDMRNIPDFGLGSGVDSGTLSDPLVQDEIEHELLASCLGVLMEREFNMDWQETYIYHQWADYSYTDFLNYEKKLRVRGLTKRGGHPIISP